MTPYYADAWLTIHGGDCRTVLPTLPAESVHCVVTSPPYWGLRDYGTATWAGGGEGCDHRKVADPIAAVATSTLGGGKKTTGHLQEGYGVACLRCGATRVDNQLGLEPTPEEYVANLVAVFREVRRVLRDDGTLWLNLGDTYAATTKGSGGEPNSPTLTGGRRTILEGQRFSTTKFDHGLKPKDLVGIPWRVAFALQADGWYLRSDIIWSKPNPMPESVTDRPTKSHEYLFLLAKSPRYYFDADAVREAPAESVVARAAYKNGGTKLARNIDRNDGDKGQRTSFSDYLAGRNIRSVWTVATAPYPGAHFATFPPKLVEPCVKAGCPENGVVLDPFAGSGTVGMVAQRLSRRAVLIDLNPEYLKQQLERNALIPLGLSA